MIVDLKDCDYLVCSYKIKLIAKKFGDRIKKLKFWCSPGTMTSELADVDLMKILELVPNVEELILLNVSILARLPPSSSLPPMNLRQLKKLDLNHCSFESSTLLDRIPADVLSDLVFTFDSLNETIYQDFFNRQTKIKRLEIFENHEINFDHLELEHLKISSDIDYVTMLTHQKKLKFLDFTISYIDGKVFYAVLQLKDLEVFRTLIDQVPCAIFQQVDQLNQLKELRIDSHSSYDYGHLRALSKMRGMQLEKLTLYFPMQKVPEDILIQISVNFLELKHIQLVNRSIQNLITIAQHVPKLESILMDFYGMFYTPDILQIDDYRCRHENLRKIVINSLYTTDVQYTQALLKFCNLCPNLERISLSKLTQMKLNDLEQLLSEHHRLIHLSLEVDAFKFCYSDIETVAGLIRNLLHFRISELTDYPEYDEVKSLFIECFPTISLLRRDTGAELIMKKRNVENWYSSLNIVDHYL